MVENPDFVPHDKYRAKTAPKPDAAARVAEVVGLVLDAAFESLAKPENQAAVSAWFKDVIARAAATPAEDVVATAIKLAGMCAAQFGEYFPDQLKQPKK